MRILSNLFKKKEKYDDLKVRICKQNKETHIYLNGKDYSNKITDFVLEQSAWSMMKLNLTIICDDLEVETNECEIIKKDVNEK